MKKLFRRSLACIIAVVMIATSLPFSAITVGAATSNTTINRSHYGVYAAANSRAGTDSFVLVNDSQNSNFSVGYITFDISGITYTEAKRISATYTFKINLKETESLGVSVYYPTANVDSFAVDGRRDTITNIWSKDDGAHISRAKTYWGLKHIASYPTKANANLGRTVDLGPAIVAAKKAGKSTATIVFMLSKAGESGGTNGWSDSTITCSNTTASVTIYDFSDRNFTAYEATKYGSFSDDSDYIEENYYNNSYKNVLYAPNNMQEAYLSTPVSAEGKDKIYLKSHIFYGNTVLLYNGNTVPQFPIGFAITGYDKPWNYDWSNVRSYYCRIADGANGLSFKNKKWRGADGRNNVQYILNTSKLGEVDVYSDNSSVGSYYKQGETGYYANIMQYTGGDFDGSYKKINPTFEYKVGTDEGTPQVHTTGSVSGKSIYVLNYKKIIDKVNSVNSFLSTFDDSIYDTTTLNAYYNAIYKMFAFDPSLYDYDANTEQAVIDAANDMDSLIAAVDTAYNNLKLKKVTVSFRTQTNNVIENRVIEYGSKIGAFPSNSAPQTHNDDQFIAVGKHNRFSWPTEGYTADSVVTSDIIIKEVNKYESCTGGTATCTAKAVCTVCGLEYGETDPDNHDPIYEFKDYKKHIKTCSRCDLNVEEDHTDDGTGKCTLCRGTIIDKTALNAAIATAKPIYDANNTDGTYVAESFNEFKAVYERVTAANPTTQEGVNSLTAELTTATNILRKTTLTYKFDEKVANTTTVKENSTASYGEVKEFTVTDGDVEQWVIVTDNGKDQPATTTYIKTGENTISLVITRNVHVTAHIAENSTSQQNITKVVFRGRNNAVVAIKYIEADEHLATAGVDIPTIPFYKDGVWDKDEVIGLANGGEITVRAQYTFNGAETDKCGIHFTDFEGGVKKFNYDTLVKLNGTSTYYGMYEDEAKTKLLTYFETDEFYAPHNPNIYVYALDSVPPTASVGVTGSYSGTDNDAGKKFATFNCKFYVPDGATVLEWGIKATAGGKTITFKSDTKSRRNEYSFRINFAQSLPITSVDAQAYIIYELGGTRKTVFSNNTVTQSF